MSHIVIHEDNDSVTQYRQFDDVSDAAAYLEDLANEAGIAGARLFALEEVEFAVKSYVRIEIGAAGEDPSPAEKQAGDHVVEYVEEVVEYVEEDETRLEELPRTDVDEVEYVEAAMSDEFVPDHRDETVGGESRRGLFGR